LVDIRRAAFLLGANRLSAVFEIAKTADVNDRLEEL
jgi:hypothetical protein